MSTIIFTGPGGKNYKGDWKDEDPDLRVAGMGAENELAMALTRLPDDELVLLYKAQKQKQRHAPLYLTSGWQSKAAVSEKDEEAKHNSAPDGSVPFASNQYESDEQEHPPEDYYDLDLQQWMEQLTKEDAEAARQMDRKDALDEDEANRLLHDLQREVGFPSFSSFVRARHHPSFKNLKRRPKHSHCRCPTCTELTSLIHRAARNKQARADFDRMLKAHYFEVKRWRSLERQLHAEARLNPDSVIVLSADATSRFGFPHMTRRPIKSMPSDAVYMTPWNCTNHGTGEDVYMYDINGKWMHGADYLCTNLYTILRRIKTKPEGPDMTDIERKQKRCQKLVLMGDNVSENKNNTVLQFCSELVARGWFAEVQLLYGPVGHTHNGNDAVHYIHNQIAGNLVCITPAELFNNYKHAWHTERKRPQPIIVETQWAWTTMYAPCAVRVGGFKNDGVRDPDYVRAFRFCKDSHGVVEMFIKGSPAADAWHGENSRIGAPGYKLLRELPPRPPLPKRPRDATLVKEYYNRLAGDKLRKFCNINGLGAMLDILLDMAKNGCVPSLGAPSEADMKQLSGEQRKKMRGYGVIEKIGDPTSHWHILPFMRDPLHYINTVKTFWELPVLQPVVVDVPTSLPYHLPGVTCPLVTYTSRQPAKRAPVVNEADEEQEYAPSDKSRKRPPSKNVKQPKSRATTSPVRPKPTTNRRKPLQKVDNDDDEDMETSADSDSSWDPQKDEPRAKRSKPVDEVIPASWDTPYSDLQVGGFAAVEAAYGRLKGIAVVQVSVFHLCSSSFSFVSVCLSLVQITKLEEGTIKGIDWWSMEAKTTDPQCIRYMFVILYLVPHMNLEPCG
jgi:hypothetical protein